MKLSSGLARIRQASWAGCAVLILLGPSARAQGFFDFFDPSPQRIEGQLQRAGFELRSPLVRRGDVYIGDVMTANGVRERLVIDAHSTKIVARYPAHGRGAAPEGGDYAESWFGSPRPPHNVGPGQAQQFDDFGPIRRPAEPDVFAGVDPNAPPGTFFDDTGRGGYPDRSRPRPHAAKPKPGPAATVAKSTPGVPEAPNAAPAVVSTVPVAVAPAAESVKAAPEAAKPTPGAKPVAEATVAPAAPPPRPSPKAKALNDLPVTPLD